MRRSHMQGTCPAGAAYCQCFRPMQALASLPGKGLVVAVLRVCLDLD